MNSFLKEECDLQFFHDNGYTRKKCQGCGDYFWTLNHEALYCGDQPCVPFTFINKPLGHKKLSLDEVRKQFISFFEEHGHKRVRYPETNDRCPVIARWREDIYLTIASIADFQPHVTSGMVPPPANPLVISQPCIRLNDLDQIGVSGRHLTIFEMMGHHAFNKQKDEIYWKEETVQYCDRFFHERVGMPRELINYKEQLWDGGGNAGPCLEVLAGGLEIATLVFMNMKEDKHGKVNIKGKTYAPNPLNIVDTGYGLERVAWVTNGTPTIYETAFPEMIEWIKNHTTNKRDTRSIYSLADHTKCLAFMLGDGIVPSNVKAGYLARLIIRRALRFMEVLELSVTLDKIVDKQLELLESSFPSLKKRIREIDEILQIETTRFYETLKKGEGLVKRILQEQRTIDEKTLIHLYDTHGIHPEMAQSIAKNQGVNIHIPENFESMVAMMHSHEQKQEEIKEEETQTKHLPSSKQLYYIDHYMKEFDAEVIWVSKINDEYGVILNQTAFYPEGGGQPGDKGYLSANNKEIIVKNTVKKGEAIIHLTDEPLEKGMKVHGRIDWDRRYALMKHHTGTHVVNGALRRLLGEHIWQAGSQLSVNEARFDFSHYKSITEDERKKIEQVSNELVKKGAIVEKKTLSRNEAERLYGFRLYQGGVPPGDTIRVIHVKDIDVEACGGTHLNNINEIEKIRIIKTERIQDGVNRIIFAAGEMADEHQLREQNLYHHLIEILLDNYTVINQESISEQLREASQVFSVPVDRLEQTIKRFLNESKTLKKEKHIVKNLPEACNHLFETWKKTMKKKKQISPVEIEALKKQAEMIPGTGIKIITTRSEYDGNATAGALINEPDIIAHVYDGDKITSAASENIDIDLRVIAPEIGRILGGSGGGKTHMTQSGGPLKDKADEALETAKILTIKLITEKQVKR